MKRRARRKTMRCWPRQSANQPAIGFPTIPPKGSTVIGGNVSLELAFTVLMSFYVFWPAKTMPTPKGLMPSCLARIGRKGVTGAAAAKMRKKWPCVVGKCPKYWIINLWNISCCPSNVREAIAHKVTYITFTGRRSWFRPNPILFRLGSLVLMHQIWKKYAHRLLLKIQEHAFQHYQLLSKQIKATT